MATHKINGGQLHMESLIRGRNCEYIILNIWDEEVVIIQWQRKGVKPEKSEHRFLRHHGDV